MTITSNTIAITVTASPVITNLALLVNNAKSQSVTAPATLPFTAFCNDQYNNPVSGATLTLNGGPSGAVTATTNSAGQATFSVTFNSSSSAGTSNYTFTVTAGSVTSNSVTVTTATSPVATTITLSSSFTSATAGAIDSFGSIVHDQFGNLMANVGVTLTDSTTGATFAGTTNNIGAVAWNVTFSSPGTYSFVATVP